MITPAQLVGSSWLGASSVTIAQDAAQGIDSSLYGQIGIAAVGLSMFLFFDKRERNAIATRNDERRASDKAKDDRITQLEAALERTTIDLITELKRRYHDDA